MRRASARREREVSGGLLASGPGEVRLRRREDCAEDPDDTANRAGLASEVDQDDADHARHDGSVHQVLRVIAADAHRAPPRTTLITIVVVTVPYWLCGIPWFAAWIP